MKLNDATLTINEALGALANEPIFPTIPLTLPTPTIEYRAHRKAMRATVGAGRPSTAMPIPTSSGVRVLLWRQDPTVAEMGIRKAYLPGLVLAGPRDARILMQGMPLVSLDAMGDLIEAPGTEAFDAVHTFAVVRETLTMYQRVLGGVPLPWQWNSATNTDPIGVFPHAGVTMNAFYSRNERVLKFFFFSKPGSAPGSPQIFTCRSLDIVAHETGHAILDGLKPGWLLPNNPPQTGGLHESFGDLTAIFLTLSQMDQVEAIIAQTKANLHDKTFLSDMAEEFGLALGRPNGLRNADNDFKLSEVGTEVHAISQVFTGGIYDVLSDIFAFERKPGMKDDAAVLYAVSQYLCNLVLRAIIAAPNSGATYAAVVNQMLTIANADGKPVEYSNSIRNRFILREVVLSSVSLDVDHEVGLKLAPAVQDTPGASQNRSSCCGTMQHADYTGVDEALQAELDELKKAWASSETNGHGHRKHSR